MSGQRQRPGVVLALPVGDQFGTMTWLTVIFEIELMLEKSYVDSSTYFSSIPMHLATSTITNFNIGHKAPDHGLQKMLQCQIPMQTPSKGSAFRFKMSALAGV